MATLSCAVLRYCHDSCALFSLGGPCKVKHVVFEPALVECLGRSHQIMGCVHRLALVLALRMCSAPAGSRTDASSQHTARHRSVWGGD